MTQTGTGGRLARSLRWTSGSQVLQQLINIAWSVAMARLLEPADFGLLAMATVFTGLVYFVLDLGLGAAIIQREQLDKRQISSVFWLNLLAGLTATLIGVAASAPIAAFYRTPTLQPVVALLAVNFLLFSLSSTQKAVLTRRMDFRSLELRTMAGILVGSLGSVALALLGWGVWSLAARYLITSAVSTTLLWSLSDWRPEWHFRFQDVGGLLGFSSQVMAGNLLGFVGRNADNLLIGRFVGTTTLGYYALAFNLMMFPIQRLAQMLTSVLFPTLSRLQRDREQLAHAWLRASRMMTAITAPLMVGLCVLAPQFVVVVYGPKWLPAVPLLRILSICGIVGSLASLNSSVLLALGQSRLRLQLIALEVCVALTGFSIGLPYGAVGVACGFTLAQIVTACVALVHTLKSVGIDWRLYLANLAGVTGATVGMGLAVAAAVAVVDAPPVLLLAGDVAFGAGVYLALLRLCAPEVIEQALKLVPSRKVQGRKEPVEQAS